MRARRIELGLTQQALAAAAEISPTTLNLLELGKQDRYRPLTLAALCKALGWRPDGIDKLLTGMAPEQLIAESDHAPPGVAARRGDDRTIVQGLSDEDWEKVRPLVERLLEAE